MGQRGDGRPDPLPVGLAILALGLLATPPVTSLLRAILSGWGGWTFEPPWQKAVLTLVGVWCQNGLWLTLSLPCLVWLRGWAPGAGPPSGSVRSEVAAGIRWGFLLLFVNVITSRVALAMWERLLSPEQVLERVERERGVLLAFFQGDQPFWVMAGLVFTVTVVAPLGEEVLFRGVVYPALRERLGRGALFASAALFAAVHAYVVQFVPVFVVGVLLAWLYERRRSLLAPIVAHGVVNGVVAAAHIALRTVQLV